MRIILPALLSLAFFIVPHEARAEFNGFGESEGLTVGVAALADFSPYKDADQPEVNPVPYIAYDWENAHIGIDGVTYTFFNSEHLDITVMAEPRFSPGDVDDTPIFEGIDRNTALEAGVEATLKFGPVYFEGQFLHDVTDVYNGYEATAKVGVEQEFGRISIDVGGGVVYRDKNLNDHLFGVRAEEVRADRPAFAPRDAANLFAEAELAYAFDNKTMVFGFAKYTGLSDRIQTSPLVDRDRQITGGLAILRRF